MSRFSRWHDLGCIVFETLLRPQGKTVAMGMFFYQMQIEKKQSLSFQPPRKDLTYLTAYGNYASYFQQPSVLQSPFPVLPSMTLARVIGNVVATQKNDRYQNGRMLLVQPINPDGSDTGSSFLVLDVMDAGVGDRVVVVQEGWSASTTATDREGAAIDSAVIAVVDSIEPDPGGPRD